MGSKILSYGRTDIIKSAFQKIRTSVNINEIEINNIIINNNNMVIKVHLNTTLDIRMLMESFHH